MLTDPKEILSRLYDAGCPTYVCNDGSRTRDGRSFCIFCDGVRSVGPGLEHYEDCLWLKIDAVVRAEREAQAQAILLGDV